MMLNGLDTNGGRDMRFGCSRSTDQNHIFSRIHELATMELAHERFIDLAGGEVEPGQVFVSREARGFHVIGYRTHFTFCHFGLEKL